MRRYWKEILLSLLGAALTLVAIGGNPMLLIFPMWIFTYLLRSPLRSLLKRLPLAVAYLGCGVVFGMLTELFAVVNNLSVPPEKRILLSPDPWLDLLYGFFYYFCVSLTWYILLRRYPYSKRAVFLLTGVYGIFTEELGQVFIRIFTVPVTGALYAVIIVFVYGIFAMLPLLLTEGRFEPTRRPNAFVRIVLAAVGLFVQWAVYGNCILPALKVMTSFSLR